jgi:HipA-like C-terminal domain
MAVDLLTTLRVRGRMQAGELLKALDVSRPTLMRLVRAAGERMVKRGKARRTTYAARRPLRGSHSALPIFRVDTLGGIQEVARLDLTAPDGCAVEFLSPFEWPLDPEMSLGWFDGLPYPLADMRPQGFLGRNFCHQYATMLQVPEDPNAWSDDHALHAMALLGDDLLGNLILGEPACRRWLDRVRGSTGGHTPPRVTDDALGPAYANFSEQAMNQGLAGSSAGGEFPKFGAERQFADGRVEHVLVKFSGNDASPGTERWSDLLVCEHLASQILPLELGVASATTRVHRHGGRTYLEVERFDRHGAWGRSGVVSWGSLNGQLFGLAGEPWPVVAQQVQDRGWLSSEDAEGLTLLWHFGRLIGNTDMHDGNLSFQPMSHGGRAGLQLAPSYDMLPMLYAPVRGMELTTRTFSPRLPLPHEQTLWTRSAHAAMAFWALAANDERISAPFRRVCDDNATVLHRCIEVVTGQKSPTVRGP